ncbi:MAG: hypothetical protein A3G20_07860 [Acidobacteria bacterium RIFCSPLOWO2_12_FULL_59_11]|nr:MAG: hypothetical protein A3G20_07860 [Acidobacteria bacterium RIFCSPLOWO2_12_FULL_59_11]
MKKYFAFLLIGWLLFLSIAIRVQAQGEGAIHGIVVAKADGSALPDAAVRLEGLSVPGILQTSTAGDGHFGFQRLVPGKYVLIVVRQNFLEERVQFTLKPREVRNLTLQLSLLPVEQSVEVITEAETVAPTYSPSSTTLQKQTFEALPMAGKANLTDVIVTAAPGMIRGHDDFVHVRGSEIALNTFINGVSFWENMHSVFSSGLSPDVIQSVNVMTGGFPAEYGNRFGGVLDIVTKSGFSMNNEGALTLGLGTALRHNASVEFGGHTEKAAYYLFNSASESARFLSPPDPRSIHNTGRGARSFLQLDFNVNPNNFLKLVLMGDGTNFQIPNTSVDDQIRPWIDASQRTRSQSAIFTWDRILSKDSLLHTSFYQRWSRSLLLPAVERPEQLAAIARSERTLQTFGLKSDLTRFVGRHTLKGGLDLVLLRPEEELLYNHRGWMRFSRLIGLPHVMFDITFLQKKTGGQVSFYLQDKVQLTDSLTIDMGLRYDRHTLATSDFHFSPRLNLAYRFSSGTVLHGSYNHFFVPPPVEFVLAGSAGLTRFIRGFNQPLPPLRPTAENQFEAGVTHPFHHNFQLGLTGYYRLSNDQFHTVVVPDSRIYLYANFDKAKAYGLEIKAEVPAIQRLGLSGFLNYALSRVYLYNPITAGFTAETDHISEAGSFLAPMDQTHTLNAGFTYRHRGSGLWASMAFEYGSGTPVGSHAGGHAHDEASSMAEPVPERVPEHFTQNLTLGWDVLRNGEQPRFSLQFNIENLSDNVYRVAQESVFSPGQYSIPRLFSGSVKARF